MVKTYQLDNIGYFGASLKVAPVTTDDNLNLETCLQVNGTSDYRIEPQAILPNVTDFKLAGNEENIFIFLINIIWVLIICINNRYGRNAWFNM